jgi:pro-kumamolisin-like protein/IPT/TIG domain-containing protein/List-Bact-rpt repeat protein
VRTAPAVALLVGVCCTLSAAGAGAAASGATRIVAAAPRLPHAARVLGAVRADATVSGAVVLRPRSERALTRFLAAVTDKHSPLFHHYLAQGQFAARFGPAPSSVAVVTARLRAAGLDVTVAPNGMLIDFRGSAAQVESAFGVGLNRIRLADGSLGRARTAAIRLPASIAGLVTSVVGLDNVVRLHPAARFGHARRASLSHSAAQAAAFSHPAGSPTPCAGAQKAATQYGGLTDDQIANAYGAFGLYGASDLGAGQSIAVFELEPFAATDIHAFDTCYFGATAATAMAGRLSTIPVDGGQPVGAGSGEALLDIEDVSGLAPGANIDVYEAPNTTFGSLDEYARIINDDADQIVTSSWGLCEQALEQGEPGVLQAENLLFEQAALQGQSVFAAAGDSGSDTCNAFGEPTPTSPVLSQGDPASQPYVVGVGGTSIDSATQPADEHVWNDGAFWGAGGGGISQAWPMPGWQLSASPMVPGIGDAATIQSAETFEAGDLGQPGYAFCKTDNPAGANQAACREVPDVSAQADEFTGAITVYAGGYGGWSTSGGTSSAAPIWAALLAIVNASPTCPSDNKGVGFVSPLLYSVAANPTAYAASFNDVTAGNNDAYGASGLFPATTGYDMATGLGSPQLTQPGNGAGLAYYLCTAAASGARPTVSDITANVAFTSAPSTAVTITGANFETNSNPDVAAVQIGDYVLPPADFEVDSPTSISATFPAAAKVLAPQAPTDGAGRVQVVVTLTDGESSAPSSGSAFTYVDNNGANSVPSVTSIGPYAGSEAGGNTVDIYGAGFTGATAVEFGGVAVAASDVTVLHDWEIATTVPPYAGGTTTCAQDGSFYGNGENATNDVCQVQVVVSNAHGSSATSTILPLYEGDASYTALGVIPTPAGVEPAPAPTEYDYLPAPTITSISTDDGPTSLASEDGGSVVTIKGTGLNFTGLAAVYFGDPTQADSQDYELVTVTGTEIQIVAPPREQETTSLVTVPVTVQTIAGESAPLDASYAGVPRVSGVIATDGPTFGTRAGPDTGGTPIDVTGKGFANEVFAIAFADAFSPFSFGTQYNFTAHSNFDLSSTTVQQNPAVVDVEACTVTACSPPTLSLSDGFLLYPPGDPKIDSITPAKGPASGSTAVTITGENLGCVTGVYFGKVAAKKVSSVRALLDCGSTTRVTAVSPPGKKGKSVRVTVTTVESGFTGSGPSTGSVMFHYTRSTAELLTVDVLHYGGGGSVTSKPAGVRCSAHECSHRFAHGSTVTLTAKPSHGSRFAGWSGACHGKGTCVVRMKSAKTVEARFVS